MIKAESLAMVATDGHRLSFVEKPNETLDGISGEKRVLIPRKALQELQHCFRLPTPKRWSLPMTSIRCFSAWAIAP